MAPFTRRQTQLISQVHGEETPVTGSRRLESVRGLTPKWQISADEEY